MHIYIFTLIFLYFSQKYAKFNFYIDTNSYMLPAYNPAAVLRTPVMSSCLTCYLVITLIDKNVMSEQLLGLER